MTEPPLRVLVVCAINGYGGPVRSIVTVLTTLGGRVDAVAASQRGVIASNRPPGSGRSSPLEAATRSLIELPRPRGWNLPKAQFLLARRWRAVRRNTDVIHANGLTESVLVAPLAVLARRPVVVWVHNYATPRPFRLVSMVTGRLLARWQWPAVSAFARDLLLERLRGPIIPNPVATNRRATPHAPASPLRVAYLAGNDLPVKGFDLLPAIIEAVDPQHASFTVYAARSRYTLYPGSEAAWDRLTGDLADRVDLRPFTDDVSDALAQCDVVLAPSRLESFNRVIAEAAASGVPVVASDLPPHLEHGPVGEFFPVGDAFAAARAITALAKDPERWWRCSRAGPERARAYGADQVAERLLAMWQQAAGR